MRRRNDLRLVLEDQIKQLKLRLEESERLLLEFGEREQIVVVTEKSSIAENYLAAANAVKAIQGFRTGASADRRNAR